MQRFSNKKGRLAACLLAVVLAVTGIPTAGIHAQAAEGAPESGNLLARYPLQEDANDISSNNKHGEAHGNVAYNDGLVLSGGKKTSAADAPYVTLPGELFMGKEKLTISVWIKNASDKGNYAALFFGTAPQANNMPLNYWLFNPINPDSRFKSVFTNSDNSDAPYSSEAGVTAGDTAQYKNKWAHYTTVLTEDSITGYINGVQIGTASKTKKVADFKSEIQAYIGRSNYVEDNTYGGSFRDLKIYEGAMTANQAQEQYFDTEYISPQMQESLLPSIADQLSLEGQMENGVIMEAKKLELPGESYGATITWSSDKEAVISGDGQVTLPAQQETVTLTASLQLGNAKESRTFVITVVPADSRLAFVKENLQVPYVLDNGAALPTNVSGISISWSGSSAVKSDGSIAADFKGKQEYQLMATLSDGSKSEQKTFRGWLLGADAGYVASYTRTPSGDCVDKLARSMFLAYSENGRDGFTALHDDYGVLFMRAESKDNEQLVPKGLKDPYLFYTKDDNFGVAAVRTEEKGGQDATKASSVMFYTTKDFVDYDEVGFVDLKTDLAVCEPVCEYDSAIDSYRLTWNDGAGNYYQNTLSQVSASAQVSQPVKVPAASIRTAELGLTGAKQGNFLPLENAKGMKLKNKLSKLVNTGMEVPTTVKATSAEDMQAIRAIARYNDGSIASKSVEWDVSKVDFSKPGACTATGTVTQPTFNNSQALFHARPDPQMVKYNGKFYFISTDENGQGKIYIRQSDTLEGIKNSSETLLLDGNSFPQLFKTCLWAPELHVIEGKLYIFFAGSLTNWSGVQSHVMQLKEGGDPMVTADWETPIRVQDMDGNNLYDTDTQGITLDMTYFQVGEQGYVAWAQRQLHPVDTGSWLYIATVDKERPWQLTSERTAFCKPDYGWDNNNTFVVEAPFTIQKDGKIYLTFSGGATDHTYCIGLMTASADSNLLDASSWRKRNAPILTSWSVPGQYGPGHNAYIVDDDGVMYNIYHAKWGRSATRSASIRRVHFDIDGEPVLDVVEERDLLEQYKSVTTQVNVQGASYNPKEDLKEQNKVYTDLKNKTGQSLTSDADWKEFCDSLAQAEELLKQANAPQVQVMAALNRLEAAAAKLCYIAKLEILAKPTKLSYKLGEALNLAGLKLEAVDNKGGRYALDVKDCTVSGFRGSVAGTQKVTVSYQGGKAEFTVTVSGASTPRKPGATSIAKKSAVYNAVTLQWKKISGASGYDIYRADSKKGKFKKVKTITNPKTVTYKDGKLSFNKTYYYKIKVYAKSGNKKVESAFSKTTSAKTALAAPAKVSLKNKGKMKLNIGWKKVAGASGYKVQYSLKKKSGFKTITIKKAKTASYTKSGLKKGKTYYVRVCAYRTVKGKKVAGKWSKVVSKKLK